jgi:hypothetical protein
VSDRSTRRIHPKELGRTERLFVVLERALSGVDDQIRGDAVTSVGVGRDLEQTLPPPSERGRVARELGTCADVLRRACGLAQVLASCLYGIDGSWNEATKRVAASLGLASATTKVRATPSPRICAGGRNSEAVVSAQAGPLTLHLRLPRQRQRDDFRRVILAGHGDDEVLATGVRVGHRRAGGASR